MPAPMVGAARFKRALLFMLGLARSAMALGEEPSGAGKAAERAVKDRTLRETVDLVICMMDACGDCFADVALTRQMVTTVELLTL